MEPELKRRKTSSSITSRKFDKLGICTSVPSLKQGCWAITNVLIPRIDAKQGQSPYEHATVVVRDGWISTIAFGIRQSCPEAVGDPEFIDGTDKLLLPGFMNGHTHSSEMWVRGQIGSYPLELWLACLRDFSPGDCESVYLSALHTAYKTLMSGGTALMDHLSPVPDKVVESVKAGVTAYTQAGIRAWVAPLIGDLDFEDSIPLASASPGSVKPEPDVELTQKLLNDMTKIVEECHRPDEGISIAVGPTGFQLTSTELYKGLIELSKQHNLARHTHVLETQAQKKLAHQRFGCSAVEYLEKIGFLGPNTSCAHCVWLNDQDIQILKQTQTTVVHDALSNMHLGSGIAPVLKYRQNGVNISFGCDGATSNDSQDMLEAVKMGTILHNTTDKEYRNWITPSDSVKIASKGGYTGAGRGLEFGQIAVGNRADIVLYDLSNVSTLPRTDPLEQLILGRSTKGVVDSVWVDGRCVVKEGVCQTINIEKLTSAIKEQSAWQLTPRHSESLQLFEPKYRQAMGLEPENGKD